MKYFTVRMFREVQMFYDVEAETAQEALDNVLAGKTNASDEQVQDLLDVIIDEYTEDGQYLGETADPLERPWVAQ